MSRVGFVQLYKFLKPKATAIGIAGFYPIRQLGIAYMRTVRVFPKVANLFDFSDGWRVIKTNRENMTIRKGEQPLLLDRYHGGCMLSEVLVWPEVYLPGFSLKGKTVLDIGAGCGETAQFFFDQGAVRVVCVEADYKAASYIAYNVAKSYRWGETEIHGGVPFALEHLSIPHDFLKMDIEGGEKILTEYEGSLGPCRIELHPELIGKETTDKIIKKFDLRQIQPGVKETSIWGRD